MFSPSAPTRLAANLELKAHDPSPRQTAMAARAAGAEDHGTVDQRDTFFWAPVGRLKLREESDHAELIYYRRPDRPQAITSRYTRLPVADAAGMRAVLAEHLGITAIVTKQRRLLLKDNVRIHLDRVEGLGDFVELEAVPPPGNRPETQLDRINALRRALGISDDRLVATSYADALAESQPPAGPREVTPRAPNAIPPAS